METYRTRKSREELRSYEAGSEKETAAEGGDSRGSLWLPENGSPGVGDAHPPPHRLLAAGFYLPSCVSDLLGCVGLG